MFAVLAKIPLVAATASVPYSENRIMSVYTILLSIFLFFKQHETHVQFPPHSIFYFFSKIFLV